MIGARAKLRGYWGVPTEGRAAALGSVRRPSPARAATGEMRRYQTFAFGVTLPCRPLVGASYFDLPAQLHDPVRGDAKKRGRIQGEVAQEDEQPVPQCQESE